MNHIETKQDFYRLSRKLLLGNILNQWDWPTFERMMGENPEQFPKIVGVRHVRQAFTNKGNSGLMERSQALVYGRNTPDKHNLLFDEGAIHDKLTIQGEILADWEGLYVRYSELQCHQRTLWHIDQHGLSGLKRFQLPHNLTSMTAAQRAGLEPVVKHARGLKASMLLKQYMDPMSLDMVNGILSCQLEPQPDLEFNFCHPVVEFACFSCPVGQLRWNTLIWEVRTRY